MSRLRRFAAGFVALVRGDRLDRELDEELRGYLEDAAAGEERAGATPEAARRAARLGMGSADAIRMDVRAVGWEASIDALGQDLRYAARGLRRNPGFTAAAVATLALGIGANTVIFSAVSAVLLDPLPYPAPENLVVLAGRQSLPDVIDIAERSRSFSALGVAAGWALDLIGDGEPTRVDGALIGGDLFRALGVEPSLGRTFGEADDRALAPVAVVSERFWRAHLRADPGAVGRPLTLSGKIYTVVGVMPAEFRLPFFEFAADIFIPFRVGYPEAATARGAHFTLASGRLRDGVSPAQAQDDLDRIGRQLAEANPTEARTFAVQDLREAVVGDVRTPLLILLGAVGLVLLIACSNFGALLLARGAVRTPEMQVRHALGASTGRLLRQLLTESAFLSFLGGAAGLLLAGQGLRLLVHLAPADLPAFRHLALDLRTLLVTLAISILTGLVFGLGPAWSVRRLRANAPSGDRATTRHTAVRRGLVIGQLALAGVLLIGAGLLMRSFWRLRSVPMGFEPDRVLTLRLNLPASRYESIATQVDFLERLEAGLRAIPGAASVGLISELPLSGWRMMHNMIVEGQPIVPEGQEPEIYAHEVSPAYFAAIGTPLLDGRGFTDRDGRDAPLVGVVNQAFVRRYFPDRDPVGGRARWAQGPPDAWITVVGVVADARFEALDEEQPPTIYTPCLQKQQPWKRWAAIVIRGRSDATLSLAAPVREAVWRLDPALPITGVATMSAVVRDSVSARRLNLVLLTAFAALAVILAAIGVYGVLAHLVAQRTREIGVRMAVGAQRADILILMLRQGLGLVAWGILGGGIGALLVTRVLRTLLYGVAPTDPATFATVLAGLALLGLLASLIPARHALRVDPVIALRHE